MPTQYKAMAWNIETMGDYYGDLGTYQRSAVAMFVASLISNFDVDVLVIQELKQNGIPMLNQIVANLGRGWTCTYLPAGIVSGDDSAADVALSTSTSAVFNAIDCNEGYGLIYNNKLKIHTSWDGKNLPISLCKLGTDFNRNTSNEVQITPIGTDCSKDVLFPSAAGGTHNIYSAVPAPKTNGLAINGVRRPCRVDLGNTTTTVSFIVYHCPKSNNGSALGANCTALLQEVRAADVFPNVIVAGDYNFTDNKVINNQLYKTLGISSPQMGFTPGTAKNLDKPKYSPSMVHFTTSGKYEIVNPRDVLFYRLTPAIKKLNSGVLDIPSMLIPDPLEQENTFSSDVISNSSDFVNIVFNIKKKNNYPDKIRRAFQSAGVKNTSNLKNLFSDNDKVTEFDENTAALFYLAFVSDHLPVFIEFEI